MKKPKDNSVDLYQKKSSPFKEKLSILRDKLIKVPKWRLADEVGIVFFAAFIIATTLFYFNEWKFTQEDWKSAPGNRHEMVDDLIDSEILLHKSKPEIISILGEPNSDTSENQDIFSYQLGKPPSFFSSKHERLLIVFEKDIVKNVSIETE